MTKNHEIYVLSTKIYYIYKLKKEKKTRMILNEKIINLKHMFESLSDKKISLFWSSKNMNRIEISVYLDFNCYFIIHK